MQLAIFDLDNTLIAGDSDYLWGEFLCEQQLIDEKSYHSQNKRYYDDYRKGELDIEDFLRFQLHFIAGKKHEDLEDLRKRFIDEKIRPILLRKAIDLIDDHRKKHHRLLVITATNRFITEPISRLYNIVDLIATEVEISNGVYTGRHQGTPSYAAGKIKRLEMWLLEQSDSPSESWFYSDSHNDIPLLNYVDHPVAVDPDETLRQHARGNGWKIISLR